MFIAQVAKRTINMAKSNWNINKKLLTRSFPDLEESIEATLISRGIKTKKSKEAFFNPDYDRDSRDPFLMKEMDNAVERCLAAINKKQKICVFADYDADGITSSVILIDFLHKCGADVISYIPDRNKEGYSMNREAIDYIKQQETELIITVDCGISNDNEISYASKIGIDVVILDHHHVPSKVPNAVAVVDPKQKDDQYPDKNLAGVGVTFKFLQALSSKLSRFDIQQLKWALDLVAIGTIADCVPLTGENRMFCRFGLLVLSKTNRTGLKQLFHVGRIPISPNQIPSSETISFQVAPRLNAAGRMDHANIAQNLLLCSKTEESKARLLALDIEEKNNRRQKVTKQIVDDVKNKVDSAGNKQKIIIEYSENWGLGVVGLAAGKISDQYQKPTILLKDFGQYYKGSGRSIDDFNMVKALEDNEELLEKYGGHAQAVGLEIAKDKLDAFVKAMNSLAELIPKDRFDKIHEVDYELNLSDINENLFSQLQKMEPFGEGNRRPVFITKEIFVTEKRFVGNGEKHLKLTCSSDKNGKDSIDAIGFRLVEKFSHLKKNDKINMLYHIDKNYWNGEARLQALLIDIEIVS